MSTQPPIRYDVVVPTTARPSLDRLLRSFADCSGGAELLPVRVLLVDDRPARSRTWPLPVGEELPPCLCGRIGVLRSGGRGPAAARNVGWRAASEDWIAFLDDDVILPSAWCERLQEDLLAARPETAGVQGRIHVPLPATRRPTDWERNVASLEGARWATADLAYRRAALAEVDGFDERFHRNYREDADLGLRLTAIGWEIARGRRHVVHPVATAGRAISLWRQAGNADDVLMRRLHGPDWRARAGAPRGRLRRHAAIAAAGLLALGATAGGRPRLAAVPGALWAAGTSELATARIAPGPRTPGEVAAMIWTSALLPVAATGWWLRGVTRSVGGSAPARSGATPPAAVLLDRDGTLVVDVPYNGDPTRVERMPGAHEALSALRGAGVATAVVSNQSGIGRGLLSEAAVAAVNARIEQLLGPLGPWLICPHAPEIGCSCRKPAPGLVLAAAARLGVDPRRCAVVGDIGADVDAARAAGARGVLVPTSLTRPAEIAAAQEVAPDLLTAVRLLVGEPASARVSPNVAQVLAAA